MKSYRQVPRFALVVLTAAFIFICSGQIASGQESQGSSAPRVELLTMNGSKPNLSATGEGITSNKIGDLYNRGSTRIALVKASEARYKIEIPVGYNIFNNLIYAVETDAVFTGPTDVTFQLPSARTEQTFNQLRILYAEYDQADPNVPRWIDATLPDNTLDGESGWLSASEIKQRLRDFKTRTLHAVTREDEPFIMVVALMDPTKVRDNLTADLDVGGTATAQVTEGRSVTYALKITNKGPDAASAISLHATSSFSFISVNSSVGKCRMAGQNVYCKFPDLEKGRTIEIKLIERCEWGRHFPNAPPGHETPTSILDICSPLTLKRIQVLLELPLKPALLVAG